jgi:hypothetical protein
MVILLMVIFGYLLMANNSYSIGGYFIDGY